MKKIIYIIGLSFVLYGCEANSDNYSTPDLSATGCMNINKTKEISQFYALLNTPLQKDKVVLFETDDVIEGFVVSNDKEGNFYKSLSVVALENGIQRGFSISLDETDLSNKYEPGRKIYLKLKDKRAIFSGFSNSIEFGSLNPEFPTSRVGRINPIEIKGSLIRGCEVVSEETLVNTTTIAAVKNDNFVNRLVEIDNVQFTDLALGKNYYSADSDPSGNGFGYHSIIDQNDTTLEVSISKFCSFSGLPLNGKSGKIRGVLKRIIRGGPVYQLTIRSLDDIKFTNERLDNNPPIGGSAITYTGTFNENFESYTAGTSTTGQKDLPKYINDPFSGKKYWYVASFSGNKYLIMSAFSSSTAFQDSLNKSYFIMPVDFSAANSIQFKSQDRFNNGGVLKVYYSTNYTPKGNISTAALTDITSNFTIATGTTGGTSVPFVNSGVYNFPASLTGNGYIIFEYTGGYSFNPALTTTIHLDDIEVN